MNTENTIFKNTAPNTDSKAKAVRWEIAPSNRRVIEVKNAFYRSASFNGKFLVAESVNAYGRNKDGHKTIEVECCWYGWQPKTRGIRLTIINEEVEIKDCLNVYVIKDIGK